MHTARGAKSTKRQVKSLAIEWEITEIYKHSGHHRVLNACRE